MSSRKPILLAGALIVLTIGAFVFARISKSQIDDQTAVIENPVATGTPAPATFGLPARLYISRINLNVAVHAVGLTADGAMDVPASAKDVGWFNVGPRPGENGTAVIDGHYGLHNGQASVFDDLHKLRKGDQISVQDDSGAIINFVVREIRRYDPRADASAVFGTSTGGSHLNLVTCEGDWNTSAETYTQRLVVFADKE